MEGKDLRTGSLDPVDTFRLVTGSSCFCLVVGILVTLGFLLRSFLSSVEVWTDFGERGNLVFASAVTEADLRLALGSCRLMSSAIQRTYSKRRFCHSLVLFFLLLFFSYCANPKTENNKNI